MDAASSGLQLAGGMGLTLGPAIGRFVFDVICASGFWIYLFLIHTSLGLFGIYRMTIRTAVPLEEQGTTVLVSSRASPVSMELYPDAEEKIN